MDLKYILNEIKLGVLDNLSGIQQMVFHPIQTFQSILLALRHPIITLQNMVQFAKAAPIRFGTNITLSYLEGRALTWAWGKYGVTPKFKMSFKPLNQTNDLFYYRTFLNYFPDLSTSSLSFKMCPYCASKSFIVTPSLQSAPIIGATHTAVNHIKKQHPEKSKKSKSTATTRCHKLLGKRSV